MSRADRPLCNVSAYITGVRARKDNPMMTIGSSTLIRSRVELFETIRRPELDESVTRGAEERLKQQGLTEDQMKQIKEQRKPDLYVSLRAPIYSVVMKRKVRSAISSKRDSMCPVVLGKPCLPKSQNRWDQGRAKTARNR
ncbi:MAG: efflux RND transporter periplasmic adaptor subunit [Deltaproteobacteria bacterium]